MTQRENIGSLIAYKTDWPKGWTIMRAGGTILVKDEKQNEFKITVETLEPESRDGNENK